MKRSLILERDDMVSESHSKKARISPIDDEHRKWVNTSECHNVTLQELLTVSLDHEIFSGLLSPDGYEAKFSNTNFNIEHTPIIETVDSNNDSHSKTVYISPIDEDHEQSNNTFEITSTISNGKCEQIIVNNPAPSTSTMKHSLILERDDVISKSHSKNTYISPRDDDHRQPDNKSEYSSGTLQELLPSSMKKEIFSCDGNESRFSSNNYKIEHSPILENEDSNSKSHSKTACISPKNDDNGHLNNAFEIATTFRDAKCEKITVSNSVASTSMMKRSQILERDDLDSESHSKNAYISFIDASNSSDSVSTLGKLNSADKTLVSDFPFPSQEPSACARNFEPYSYDNIPKNIHNIMISIMKDGDPDIEILPFLIEKIRIRNKLMINLNNRVAKVKNALKEIKREVDILKPDHPNGKQTQCMKILETIIYELDDLPSIFSKNSAQDISDVIPKRIKSIISETKHINKNNALDISTLEAFFNKARSKKNVRTIAILLNIPISHLKKHLNEIKMNYYRNPEKGNKKEKQFMKRLERILNSLKRRSSTFTRNSPQVIPHVFSEQAKEIILQTKSGTLDVNKLKTFLKKAKNRKDLINMTKLSKTDSDDLSKNLNVIKSKYDGNLESNNREEKQFMKRLERIINSLNGKPSILARSPSQENHDVIPEQTREIILQIKSGALDVSKLKAFLNKAKNRENLINIAKLSETDVDDLSKSLNTIKSKYDRNLESDNKEEKQFMKRLERIINSLKRRSSKVARSSDQDIPAIISQRTKKIIWQIKSSTLDIVELKKFLNKAKNRKNLISIAKSSKIASDDLKKYLNTIKSRYDGSLESSSDKEKQFVKSLERMIDQLDCPADITE
ncbi:unnamed protein product [Larinioides sclopetarius]|uniref:Uncharacterized protein n=1 Tax=Larinioides sclopetarius TaxID=280406 RepID=A0AAV1ZEF4_9ARAC